MNEHQNRKYFEPVESRVWDLENRSKPTLLSSTKQQQTTIDKYCENQEIQKTEAKPTNIEVGKRKRCAKIIDTMDKKLTNIGNKLHAKKEKIEILAEDKFEKLCRKVETKLGIDIKSIIPKKLKI